MNNVTPSNLKRSVPELSKDQRLNILLPTPRCYNRKVNCLDKAVLKAVGQEILSSHYLATSQLNAESFKGSKGFSIVFTRLGIPQVREEFPWLDPYLHLALKASCNAFYLNPLVLERGPGVSPHVDCSISSYGNVMILPRLVSVLYVKVPEDLVGGELVLTLGGRLVAELQPQSNSLLNFLGQVTHSVNPVQSSSVRISLICEQYNLSAQQLSLIPKFEILSGAQMNNTHASLL